ncbi:hypothetical protein [Staphylococcus aureus]|uniref:hypothetical protein n=1 Tax=Staphylococcus aureus TaxID=1280 RepID=UPI0037001281
MGWQAVTVASNIAGFGNKEDICPIVMSDTFFTKYIDVEKNGDSNNWCTKNIDVVNDTYYHGDIVNIAFNGILKQCI